MPNALLRPVHALGGPEVREQFYTRILARYTVNAWRMLAPEIPPAPKSAKHTGRAQVVMGGTAGEAGAVLHRRRSPRVGHQQPAGPRREEELGNSGTRRRRRAPKAR
jgi:hypothetical protein